MSRQRKLFDPHSYLQRELRLKVWIDHKDQILLDGLNSHGPQNIDRALWVVRTYGRLLRIQITDPRRPSVYKLIAQGKLEVRKGRYVDPSSGPFRNDDLGDHRT